jgi:nucleoside-diphosphate-sugar epimerase
VKILVTGASGYVAKFVIEELTKNHELILFSRRHPSQGPYATETESVFVQGDLTSLDYCRKAVSGVQVIAHIGGINVPSDDTFRVNAVGTYNLMEAAREAGVRRVVLASSNCALGHCFQVTNRPFEVRYLPFDEVHPSAIEDNYGLSKFVNEVTLETYVRAYGIEGIALRLNWCWGPAELEWRASQPFNPVDHMAGFWAYVDMRDVAQAFRVALEVPLSIPSSFKIYNVSAADTMADEATGELVSRFYPQYRHLAEKLEGHTTFFSWEAARRDLGYQPRHSWRE